MNVQSVSTLLPTFFQANQIGASSSGASAPVQTDAIGISPTASLLNQLRQLQQQSPDQFQHVVSQIANSLKAEAADATSKGNTAQANELNKMADAFQSAANEQAGQQSVLQE